MASDYKVPILENFEWQKPVVDRLTAPPAHTKGNRYLIIATASGDWSGKENQIAISDGAAWSYILPIEGMIVWVDDEDTYYKYDGSAWAEYLGSSVNPTNLLSNGDFEVWSAGASADPDGWTLVGASATIAREATIVKLGTYSAKLTRAGANCYLEQYFHTTKGIAYWRGRKVTLGCWVYATVANRALIYISDDVTVTPSSYHTGDSTWQLLSVTATIGASATAMAFLCFIATGNTSAYFDGAICVEGESCFAFSPKPLGGAGVAGEIAAMTGKTTPVDADVILIEDSASTPVNQKKNASWVNIKATLKTYFDGLYSPKITFSRSFVLTNPTSTMDSPLWRAPANITITAIHVLCMDGTNIVGQLWEYDANGLNGSTVDADITATAGTNANDDGSLTNAGIASGNYLGWKTTSVSGAVTRVIVTFEYTIN
jgi:hypothetical protein